MLRYSFALLFLICFISCDDGDVIVTNFDFEGQQINLCRTVPVNQPENIKYVFSKINPETQEVLAVEFVTNQPILTTPTDGDPYEITLNGNDARVSYRIFDSEITEDYFCNALPPANPRVLEEYESAEGLVRITVTADLDDNDGIPTEDELTLGGSEDLDGDGLLNFFDFDDDGDNVPTADEGVVITNGRLDMEASRDTDGDGIPDFMDPDDDGDGVLTINEDANYDSESGDPPNPLASFSGGVDVPDYLNPNVSVNHEVNEYIAHEYRRINIRVTIVLNNLVFRSSDSDDVIRREQLIYETYQAPSQTITVTPEFSEGEGEDEEAE